MSQVKKESNNAAVEQIMETLLNSGDYWEVPDDLLAKAIKQGLSSRFSFYVGKGCEGIGDESYASRYVAAIYPTELDSTAKMYEIIEPMIPEAAGVDGCMETEWYFPKKVNTPGKIAQYLAERGLAWDQESQERGYSEMIGEIKAALEDKTTAMTQPGVSIETDLAKNAAADEVINQILDGYDEDEEESDDAEWGVPNALVEEAGKALANRHCFAMSGDYAMITPIRFFEREGHCSDQSGPIDDILPPRCVNASESQWEFFDPAVKTPLDAAKSLQKAGFFWNRDFQDYIDESLTKELSVLEQPAATTAAVAKKTTSEQLKSTLCEIYGGAAKDWRRDSKKKNAAGQEVREFTNSETGVVVVVTQMADGHFTIKKQAPNLKQ